MGVSHSPEELARKLSQAAVAMSRDLPLVQVKEASLIVKTSVLGLAPARLRNVGKRGAKLGARYNVAKFEGEAKSIVYATGPWQLIERGTKDHDIPRVRKRGRAHPIRVPGSDTGWRMHAHHPGTKGKHPWEKGVNAAMPAVHRVFESSTSLLLHRIF